MNPRDLHSYFETQDQAFVEVLEKMVSFPTYSGEREKINRFADFLTDLFSEFNPRTERIQTPAGNIMHFTLFPEYKDFLVLLAHMDTVKVSEKSRSLKKKKNYLFGSGCYDMKNGIALFFHALKAIRLFKLRINKKIKLIFTPDEESGSTESMPVLLKKCHRARAVLLPEPCCPDGGVKIQRKGVSHITARFSGKSSHSGIEPEKGRDANRGLIQFIILTEKILQQYPDISFNPGVISGGYQPNQVSGESILRGEIRSFSNGQLHQAAKELKKIKSSNGIRIRLDIHPVHPALEVTPGNQKLYDLAREIAGSLGFRLPGCTSGGSSDCSNLSDAGIPVLDGLGMRGAGAHTIEEHIDLSDFPFRAAFMTALIQEISI